MGTAIPGDTSSATEAIIMEVAEQHGTPPEELNPPLYDVIDPEALESIFRGETGEVSFEYHGYVVTVDYEGNVSLQPATSY